MTSHFTCSSDFESVCNETPCRFVLWRAQFDFGHGIDEDILHSFCEFHMKELANDEMIKEYVEITEEEAIIFSVQES